MLFFCICILRRSDGTGSQHATKTHVPLSRTSGAAKKRKQTEAVRNVKKLSTYFQQISSSASLPIASTTGDANTVNADETSAIPLVPTETEQNNTLSESESDTTVTHLNDETVDDTSATTCRPTATCSLSVAAADDDKSPVETTLLQERMTSLACSSDVSVSGTTQPAQFVPLINEEHPTDRGLFPVNFDDSDNDIALKTFIVEHGSCRPSGPFPKDMNPGRQYKRSFSTAYYSTKTKAGVEIQVPWLCYSPTLDAAYCEPCWLFADRSDPGYRASWSAGIRDWRDLSRKIEDHSKCPLHIASCMTYQQWKHHGTIDEKLQNDIRKETSFWQQVLTRLVKVTLTLAANSLSFRGHRESIGEVYNGNFLAQVELLAEFDPVMKELLKKPKNSIKYLSPTIQNELILALALATELEHNIVTDIVSAPFYSIITDTTQDVSKIDQLSQIYRYVQIVKNDDGRPTDIHICESFLGFYACKNQAAAGISNQIVNITEGKGLSLERCRGQGYDGARTMSGVYSGVQKRILDIQPQAVYVHCAAHNLNLVVNDAVNGVKEVGAFFVTLQDLYTFFGHSIRRWDLLASFTGESDITLKKLNPTRWSGRLTTVMGIKHRYQDVMKSLSQIILLSANKDERSEAMRLKKTLERFEFVLLVVVMSKILGAVNVASQYFQHNDADLQRATEHLKSAVENLSNDRLNYTAIKDEAVSVSQKWGVQPIFEQKRQSKRKRQFDELAEDSRLDDPEDCFRVNVFNAALDILITQLKQRFTAMITVTDRFSVLTPTVLSRTDEREIIQLATKLQREYQDDLSREFPLQLVCLKATLRNEIYKLSSIKQLAHDNTGWAKKKPDCF